MRARVDDRQRRAKLVRDHGHEGPVGVRELPLAVERRLQGLGRLLVGRHIGQPHEGAALLRVRDREMSPGLRCEAKLEIDDVRRGMTCAPEPFAGSLAGGEAGQEVAQRHPIPKAARHRFDVLDPVVGEKQLAPAEGGETLGRRRDDGGKASFRSSKFKALLLDFALEVEVAPLGRPARPPTFGDVAHVGDDEASLGHAHRSAADLEATRRRARFRVFHLDRAARVGCARRENGGQFGRTEQGDGLFDGPADRVLRFETEQGLHAGIPEEACPGFVENDNALMALAGDEVGKSRLLLPRRRRPSGREDAVKESKRQDRRAHEETEDRRAGLDDEVLVEAARGEAFGRVAPGGVAGEFPEMAAKLPDRRLEPQRRVPVEPGPDVGLGGDQGLPNGGDPTGSHRRRRSAGAADLRAARRRSFSTRRYVAPRCHPWRASRRPPPGPMSRRTGRPRSAPE